MKQYVLKYIGEFSGADANGVVFIRNVPTPVSKHLYDQLITQPDFAESSLAELDAFESKATPAPASVKAKESK